MTADSNKPARAAPISVRVSTNERAALERAASAAAHNSLSAYVRSRLFEKRTGNGAAEMPVVERKRIAAKALTRLGDSALSETIGDLASAAKAGTLPLSPEVVAEIIACCREVTALRSDLMIALGMHKPGGTDDHKSE